MGGSDKLTTMLPVPGQPLRAARPPGRRGHEPGALGRARHTAGGRQVGGATWGSACAFADEAERLCLVDSPWVAPLLDVLGAHAGRLRCWANASSAALRCWSSLGKRARPWRASRRRASADGRRELALSVATRYRGGPGRPARRRLCARRYQNPRNIVVTRGRGARLIDFGLSGDASAESARRRHAALPGRPKCWRGAAVGDGRRA